MSAHVLISRPGYLVCAADSRISFMDDDRIRHSNLDGIHKILDGGDGVFFYQSGGGLRQPPEVDQLLSGPLEGKDAKEKARILYRKLREAGCTSRKVTVFEFGSVWYLWCWNDRHGIMEITSSIITTGLGAFHKRLTDTINDSDGDPEQGIDISRLNVIQAVDLAVYMLRSGAKYQALRVHGRQFGDFVTEAGPYEVAVLRKGGDPLRYQFGGAFGLDTETIRFYNDHKAA